MDENLGIGDNLKLLEGKCVDITLANGGKIEGHVECVGRQVVRIRFGEQYRSSGTGNAFEEVLIRLNSIDAVAVAT